MALWLVRAGKHGEDEKQCIEENFVTVGRGEMPDYGHCKTREELRDICESVYLGARKKSVENTVSQLWTFLYLIQIGDLIALPLKKTATIAIGEITGKYQYVQDADRTKIRRSLKWLCTDTPRSSLGQDLLRSLGAFKTVCQIRRNDAENRIKAIIDRDW